MLLPAKPHLQPLEKEMKYLILMKKAKGQSKRSQGITVSPSLLLLLLLFFLRVSPTHGLYGISNGPLKCPLLEVNGFWL